MEPQKISKPSATVIDIRQRNIMMLKKDLILRNPLKFVGDATDDILPEGGLGAILAPAGIGKTALLVQLALNAMLRNKKVLHISLGDPINKVDLWYRELFQDLARRYEVQQVNTLWESIQLNRFIMTFKAEGFSVPKLMERVTDLEVQNIFSPQVVIIDGFPFGDSGRDPIAELKEVSKKTGVRIWFTVHTHRHKKPEADGMPVLLLHVADLFDLVLQLKAEGSEIHIQTLKGTPASSSLRLDPATMLIRDQA
jgi:AAA domain